MKPLFAVLVVCLGSLIATPCAAQPAAQPPTGALQARLDALLDDPALAGAQVAALVTRLDAPAGAVLYARQPDLRLHPASNTKLVTTAAALSLLGPAFTWSTELATSSISGGVAIDLYLIGGGDPRFVSESLWRLVEDARRAGLKRVKGDLWVDDTYFTQQRLAPGFDDKDQDAAYRAASGAMSIDFNAITVQVQPGRKPGQPATVSIWPAGSAVQVVNNAKTGKKGAKERLTVAAASANSGTRVTVGGSIPAGHAGVLARRRIDDPARQSGSAAIEALRRAGIEVTGAVKTGRAPEKRRRLAVVESPSLWSVIADVNKHSNNFMAEHLVLTLGREKKGVGDWASGGAVVRAFLTGEVGLAPGFVFANGSGLFGDTRFSPRELVGVLTHMHQRRPPLPEYAASLALGGADGTLRRRMRATSANSVRAKTGTLNGVICLSGYAWTPDGTPLAFSLLLNGVTAPPKDVWRLQDRFVEALHAPAGPR